MSGIEISTAPINDFQLINFFNNAIIYKWCIAVFFPVFQWSFKYTVIFLDESILINVTTSDNDYLKDELLYTCLHAENFIRK